MKLKRALIIGSTIFLTTTSIAFAEDVTPTTGVNPSGEPEQTDHKGPNDDMRATNFHLPQGIAAEHGKLRDDLRQNRQEFKASMSAAREQMKAQSQAARDAFKAKVALLKDQKKQTVVTDVTDRFAKINTNQTNKMSDALTRLSGILDNLSSKSATAKAAGKDTTTVDADITTARAAIATAQSAVTTQAGKQYVPQVTDDATLHQNAVTTFTQLKNDLEATHKTIQSAKEAVITVAKDLAKVNGTEQ